MVADLRHAPAPKNGQAVGTNTIGSSEACMLGGMAMKWRWRKRMEAAGKPTDKPNLVCGPVQICWHKFARYWDVGCVRSYAPRSVVYGPETHD